MTKESSYQLGNLIATITIGIIVGYSTVHLWNDSLNNLDKLFLTITAIGMFIRSLRITAGTI